MKIWLFNQYALTPSTPGGSRHYELSKQLTEMGCEVTVFASSFHYNAYKELREYEEGEIYQIEDFGKLKFVWIKTFPYKGNNWRRYINILDYANKIRKLPFKVTDEKPDIILGSSFSLFTPLVAYFTAKKLKVPFILEIRDLWPETLIQLGTSKYHPLVLFLGYLERFLYKRAQHIILLFPKAHEYIESLNLKIAREKMSWIPNGVDYPKFQNISEEALSDERLSFLDNGKYNIINAGSLGNVYNLEELINAAAIVSDLDDEVHFNLVGNGPLEEELKQQVKNLQLKNVSFYDILPQYLVPPLLQKSDILYASLMNSPLYKYGMSLNKIHEYLAIGKPIVFGVNAVNNPVNDANAGITVASDNAQEIANAILNIKNKTVEERAELGQNGKKYAKNNHDFKVLGEKLYAILSQYVK